MIITAKGILITTIQKMILQPNSLLSLKSRELHLLEMRTPSLHKQCVLVLPAEGTLPPSEKGSLTRQCALSVKRKLYIKDIVDFRYAKTA